MFVGPSFITKYGTTRLEASTPLFTSKLLIPLSTAAPVHIENNKTTKPIKESVIYHNLGLFFTVINLYPLTNNRPNPRKNNTPKNNNAKVWSNICIVALSRPILEY